MTSSAKAQFIFNCDIDGVLGQYTPAFAKTVSRETGVAIADLPPVTHWSYVESGYPIRDNAHFAQLHEQAVRDGMFATMDVMDGAREALWALSDAGVYIRILTHRLIIKGLHGKEAADTVSWLEDNDLPYRDLAFVAGKAGVGGHVYLDDAPHNLLALREAGNYAIAFDQLYNRHLDGPRALDWQDATEQILKLGTDLGLLEPKATVLV